MGNNGSPITSRIAVTCWEDVVLARSEVLRANVESAEEDWSDAFLSMT